MNYGKQRPKFYVSKISYPRSLVNTFIELLSNIARSYLNTCYDIVKFVDFFFKEFKVEATC